MMLTVARTLLLTVFSVFATTSQAVSFDCQKANSFVENAICQNQTLSALDDELATVYQAAQDASKNQEVLKKQQLSWLKNKRNVCQTNSCLEKAYKKRIAALGKLSDGSTEAGDE
jgi:uncharacterized protein